ncbi:hypothetical protein LTR62_000941 [Meristemomyces frigidus]|uniref:Ribonucleases P/MRP subunit Pop8-like domain-containing protein n=1 Tax=Meristemomyces frigidus TaxID=1508187 RepID=A0AAN7YMP3_9PEZI|nr:hypothetical protein LTR62_000941 [Meristemomyces frigidus]
MSKDTIRNVAAERSTATVTPKGPDLALPAPPTKKRKHKPKPHILTQTTLRNPPWSYIHLQQQIPNIANNPTTNQNIDALTAHLHLTAALTQFLGLHGAAVPIDILRTEGAQIWIRVPAADQTAVVVAVGGWVSSKGEGWRVLESSSWDAGARGRGGGQDLFDD